MTDSIKPVISPDHGWHGVLTDNHGSEIEVFGALEIDPDEGGTRWAYPPVQYTRTDLVDPAAIREAALREAAAVAQRGSDVLGKRMRDAKDKKEKHDWQSMLFAAVDIQHAILDLIGEKK